MTAVTAERTNGSLLGPLLFQLWLFAFVAFVGTTLLFTHPVLRAGAQVAFALPLFAWALARIRGPMHLLDAAIIVGIVAHLAVSVASLDQQGSLEASGIVVVYAATFWLARHVHARPVLRRVGVVGIVVAVMFWLVVLAITWTAEKVVDVQAFGWPPRLDAHQPFVWGSVNTPPVLVLLAAPFIAWLPPSPFRRVVAVMWTLAALVIVPFSVGRAAWFGIAVALLAAEVLFGFPASRGMTRAARRGSIAARGAVAAVSLLALATVTLAALRADVLIAALDSRIRLWQQAMGLFTTDPLTGAGPSTYPWARLTQVPDFVDRVAALYAHNVAFQTLADGGILLAASASLIAIGWIALLVDRRARLDSRRRVAVAAVVGFAGMSLFDDLSFLPAVTVLVVTLAAWAIPPPVEPAPYRGILIGARGRLLPVTLALTTVLALPGVISINAARIEAEAARRSAFAGDWASALAGFERAATFQPSNAAYWSSIGLIEHELGRVEDARAAYRKARELSTGDPRPWGALAAIANDPGEQQELLLEAARRANSPQYAYRLGESLLEAGEREAAADYFAIAIVIRPALFAALSEELRVGVRQALPGATSTVGSIAGREPAQASWDAALAFGEVAAGAPLAWQAMAHLVARDFDEARVLVMSGLGESPRDLRLQMAASALARATCDKAGHEEAEAALDRLGRDRPDASHGIVERPGGTYLEQELGDYQPLDGPSIPPVPQWPLGLIEVPDCGW